jgi:hypothetical protein
VTADTKFEGVTKSFADLKAGMQAEVGGSLQSDGSFLAANQMYNTAAKDGAGMISRFIVVDPCFVSLLLWCILGQADIPGIARKSYWKSYWGGDAVKR